MDAILTDLLVHLLYFNTTKHIYFMKLLPMLSTWVNSILVSVGRMFERPFHGFVYLSYRGKCHIYGRNSLLYNHLYPVYSSTEKGVSGSFVTFNLVFHFQMFTFVVRK